MSNEHQELDLTNIEVATEMFGDNEARWFQIASRNAVADIFERKPDARLILKQPTGVGKTISNGLILASERIRTALLGKDATRPMRVLFMSHVHRLLTQAERAYSAESRIRIMNPTEKKTVVQPISDEVIADVILQSAFSNLSKDALNVDLVVIDEGHHECMTTIQHHHESIGHLPFIYITATDSRLDGMMIKADETVEMISREQAVEEGWLAPSAIHSFVDGSGRDKTNILCDILSNFADQMGQTLVFTRTKKEAEAVATHIQSLGYVCEVLLKQNRREVNQILDDFSAGKINFIVNCEKLGEGIDVQGCQSVLIGRTLDSYILLNQIIGRTARPDCESRVWELINPLSGTNLDSTVVVGEPESHHLYSKEFGEWKIREFDYRRHASTVTVDGYVKPTTIGH